MEGINTRFILSSNERTSSIVRMKFNRFRKYWIITESDTNEIIYDLHSDDIVTCNIGKSDGKNDGMMPTDGDTKNVEDITDEVDPVVLSEVVLSICKGINGLDGAENNTIKLCLQPLIKDEKKSFCLCEKLIEDILQSSFTESTDVTTSEDENKKRILILVNPKSGKGNAKVLTDDIVLPMIRDRRLDYDLIITKRALQACNFVENFPSLLHRYSTITIVSGDGLVYEVYQGLTQEDQTGSWHAKCPLQSFHEVVEMALQSPSCIFKMKILLQRAIT